MIRLIPKKSTCPLVLPPIVCKKIPLVFQQENKGGFSSTKTIQFKNKFDKALRVKSLVDNEFGSHFFLRHKPDQIHCLSY